MKKKLLHKFIAIFLLYSFVIFSFYSCSTKKTEEESTELSGTVPISYINASNDVFFEQNTADLIKDGKTFNDKFNIKLSHNNYFYTEAIYVEITTDIPEAEIYYTKNGSIPTKNNGRLYKEPIMVDSNGDNEGFILKVIALTDTEESHLLTHTYFISKVIGDRFDKNLYVFSISTDNDNLYGYENGILIEGQLRDEWQQKHRRQEPIPPDPANFNLRGREGERESYIEVIRGDGECIISQNAGVRVHGGWSRAANKKSLALYARDEYDALFDTFDYNFFPGKRCNDEFSTFKTSNKNLLLRNGGNDRDSAFIREELSHSLAKEAGFIDYHEYAPAAVFLNGKYYGFFWLQEFYNESYITETYDILDKEFIEIGEWEEPSTGNLRDDEQFLKYSEIMDIDNYMQYYAFQIFTGNQDWPHNNKKYWRFAEEGGTEFNQYYDNKYRMLLYDDEMGWGLYGAGYRERTIDRIRKARSSVSFVEFTKRPDMVEKFCNQMFDLMNSVFTYENVEENLNILTSLYENEIGRTIKAGFISTDEKGLESSRKAILSFARNRYAVVYDDMARSFKLTDDSYTVRVEGAQNARCTLNTLKLDGAGSMNSEYFREHKISITAQANEGYLFDYWDINGKKYDTPAVTIDNTFTINKAVSATLHVKNDEKYNSFTIEKIQTGENSSITLKNPSENEFTTEELYISDTKTDLKKHKIGKIIFPANSSITYKGHPAGTKLIKKLTIPFEITNKTHIYISNEGGVILEEIKLNQKINNSEYIKRQNNNLYKVYK